MDSKKADSELSLDERWQKYFFERDRDIKHLQSRGFCVDAGDHFAMNTPISIESEAVKAAIQHLNNAIASRLDTLGPGWAVGVRLKPQPYPVRQQHGEPHTMDMEWETHEMPLIDGKLVEGLAGFQYFTLADTPEKESKRA